ncbi:MAG TPA: TrkH family potassium uptake protein [Smithellaceae bacterium]|jgi:trk system potassium uptake protein TrkH|nr:TrkH family potassium uptake protein [Smithellaceae bacterium]HQK89618.1 TrkH family potassium uptake protein [Smithellaceae bacterium]
MKLYLILKAFFSRRLTPARIFAISFVLLILLGTLALWFPFAASRQSLSFTDALFASTSAVCVTGLATIDIGKDLSFIGQLITLFLFQVGGLGIITFSIVLFALMGRGISFKGREIAQSAFMHTPSRDFYLIIKSVLRYTLIIEGIGTALLFIRFLFDFPVEKALYHALYNAVSAFNNCGYSLFPDSMTRYQGDILVNVTIMLLIILGGIGFIVLHELTDKFRGRRRRLSLHTKIVLITTSALILIGAVCIFFMEKHNVLVGVSLKTAVLISFFQSVVARTAGFSTVDIGVLTNSSILLLLFLMFVGASPGSTGGGVKNTSFAILCLLIVNRMRGNENVNIANRTIPSELVDRTISIIFASVIIIGVITGALLLFSTSEGATLAKRTEFVEYIFETFSAFGTVGLSMGVTPRLNDMQKYMIILMMFIGRVGPLTLAFAWYSHRKKSITYAEETIMVG